MVAVKQPDEGQLSVKANGFTETTARRAFHICY